MRKEKTIINSSINILAFLLTFVPNLILRKVFLDTLGSDTLGLISLYTSIVGWISIVEMGIGNAIVYSLYKPFYSKDYYKVNAYINYYKKFYKIVGYIILLMSILISPLMKFFINGDVDNKFVSIGFILFSINTFISYMFSHRMCILNIAQESYKITITTALSRLIISLIQYILLNNSPNLYLYILVQIMVNYVYYVNINKYIYKKYYYVFDLNSELDKEEKYYLTKNVRSLFIHKIGNLIVFNTDNIIISRFLGLTTLTRYTNYQVMIGALQNIFNLFISGATASIGSLISEGNNEKSYDIFKKFMFINFWIASFIFITLYNTLEQFIVLWLGKESTVDSVTYTVILFNMYFVCMRQCVEIFKSTGGFFYQDRYAPICESLINLCISLYLVNKVGLSGVFIGTLCSNLLVIFWVKPYILYKYLFKKSVLEYFYIYFKYTVIGLIPLFITNLLAYTVKNNYSFYSFIVNCIINIFIINSIYIIIFHKNNEFKYFKDIFINIIQKIRGKR